MKKAAIFIMGLMILTSCAGKNGNDLPENNIVDVNIEDAAEPSKKVITVTAAGDFTLATDVNAPQDNSFVATLKAQNNDYTYFLRNVADIFAEDDLTVINFEGTLSERGERASKQFAFRGKPEYVNILTSASVEAANLSNNHSKDYGADSKEDTIKTLEDAGIAAFSGKDTEILEINGVKVGLVGINGLNEKERSELETAITSVKEGGAELVIANIHWGEESAKTPNKIQKETAREAIDLGVDLVVGHHPHVLQGIEKYNGKYIVYSLGNFCFGGNRNPSDKDTMLFRQTFTISENGVEDDDNILIIPCSISSTKERNNYQPTPLDGDEASRVMEKIAERSEAIGE